MTIKNLTPEHLRCGVMSSCPSIHRLDDGRLLIVGKDPTQCPDDYHLHTDLIDGGMAVGECAIVISPDLLADYVAEKVHGCQADSTAACEPVSPSALHQGNGGEALDRGLPRQLSIHLCAQGDLLHAFSDEVPDFYISGANHDDVLADIGPVLTRILADNYGKTVAEYCHRMTGLLSQLTDEQREALLAYDGPEYLGGDAPTASAWRPISTAPKDGTEVLLTGTMNVDGEDYPEHIAAEIMASRPVVIGRWLSSSGCTVWTDVETSELRRVQVRERWHHEGWDMESNGLEPTHWQPLPLPPQVRGSDEEAQSADEVSAADQPASLTPPNTPEKAHSASVAAEEASEANIVGQEASAGAGPTSGDLEGSTK